MGKLIDTAGNGGQGDQLLRVAQVRVRAEHADVMFYESARIYRFPRTNTAYEKTVRLLRSAAAAGTPVRVRFGGAHGSVIEAVRVDK
jgi:hypothetical protein